MQSHCREAPGPGPAANLEGPWGAASCSILGHVSHRLSLSRSSVFAPVIRQTRRVPRLPRLAASTTCAELQCLRHSDCGRAIRGARLADRRVGRRETDVLIGAAGPLGDGDEGVADRAEILVHVRARAALGVVAVAIRAAAAIEDDLHVVGVGERLAQVPIEIWTIARHDEDLPTHGPRMYHGLSP